MWHKPTHLHALLVADRLGHAQRLQLWAAEHSRRGLSWDGRTGTRHQACITSGVVGGRQGQACQEHHGKLSRRTGGGRLSAPSSPPGSLAVSSSALRVLPNLRVRSAVRQCHVCELTPGAAGGPACLAPQHMQHPTCWHASEAPQHGPGPISSRSHAADPGALPIYTANVNLQPSHIGGPHQLLNQEPFCAASLGMLARPGRGDRAFAAAELPARSPSAHNGWWKLKAVETTPCACTCMPTCSMATEHGCAPQHLAPKVNQTARNQHTHLALALRWQPAGPRD